MSLWCGRCADCALNDENDALEGRKRVALMLKTIALAALFALR